MAVAFSLLKFILLDMLNIVRNVAAFITHPIKQYVYWYKVKAKYKESLSISPSATITLDSEFEGCNAISAHSFFKGRMGYGTYISDNCNIEGSIGRFCSIAPNVCTHGVSIP